MKFSPEKYSIEDRPLVPFIDPEEIQNFLSASIGSRENIREIIQKALDKNRLSLLEVAALINTTDPELIEEIKEGAIKLKQTIYGNRIVLFAPLYIGNKCTNNCSYCGFKVSNKEANRKTLNTKEIIREVEALEENGQKRLILVFGEHPDYSAEYIAQAVKTVYSVRKNRGEIRRVNINAAPQDIEGFRKIKEAGIGTYQIFQESYHPEQYKIFHPSGQKSNFNNRLISLDRAQEAGIDDVGIGALFGLYDWRYEVMGLVRHTNHLEACYNVGPHTISFPRIKSASGVSTNFGYNVSDEDFIKMVAILRLAVPYTGLILTAREPAHIRRQVMKYGISQIDGGTRIEIGSYANNKEVMQNLNKEQFLINDSRSLNDVIDELITDDYIPSFCTACYRLGRTGEHFMEFAVPGFIKRFCSPNAILTLAEYLEDYAKDASYEKGWKFIYKNLNELEKSSIYSELVNKLERLKKGERDLYF